MIIVYDIPGKFGRVTTQMPPDCLVHGCTRLNAASVIEHKPTCQHYELHTPVERCHHGYATAVCGPCYRGEDGPPTEWLMVWMSGYLGGYATGYDHGSEDGERRYGEELAEALDPMRRAAAHGIDVAIARGAWQQHQRRMGGAAAA